MRGLKSSSGVLANASGVRVRQGSGQLNIKATTHERGLPCSEDTLKSGWWAGSRAQGEPVHAISSASGVRATGKQTGGVENKSRAIIARFDIGQALPFFR